MDDICGFELLAELFLGGMLLLFEDERRATGSEEVEFDSDLVLELVQLGDAGLQLRFHEIKYNGFHCKITGLAY